MVLQTEKALEATSSKSDPFFNDFVPVRDRKPIPPKTYLDRSAHLLRSGGAETK